MDQGQDCLEIDTVTVRKNPPRMLLRGISTGKYGRCCRHAGAPSV